MRYADDFVIMARYIGERLTRFIEEELEGRFELTINRRKTRTVNLGDAGASFDFLGYTFRYDLDQHSRGHTYLNCTPSKKSVDRERQAIREIVSPRPATFRSST